MYTIKCEDKLKPLSIYKYYRILRRCDVTPVDTYPAPKCKQLQGTYLYKNWVYGWYTTEDKKEQKLVVRYGRVMESSVNYAFIENSGRIII